MSDNFIEVVIQETAECFTTSTVDEVIGTVNVYPNPAVNYITVDYADLSNDANATLIDVQGRFVMSQALSNGRGSVRFEADNLPRGIYMLQVTSNEEVFTKRIILTK